MSRITPWGLSHTLSSEARFRILQVLVPLEAGMGLRELERATQLGIRSVQIATEGLLREKILTKDRHHRFKFNLKSDLTAHLKHIFLYLRDEQIRERAKTFSSRARQVIRLSEEVANFIKVGKMKS